jgi:hypothetical protein
MRKTPEAELERLNDEIVGYLLLRRSPPRELLAARERVKSAVSARAGQPQPVQPLRPARSWPLRIFGRAG